MTKATKAALLSGLVFPGAGHLLLRHYWRAAAVAFAALAAMSIVIEDVFQRAQSIVDRIYAGDIPADSAAITEMVAQSSNAANDLYTNVALLVLVACWLFGIVDSYRLGSVT